MEYKSNIPEGQSGIWSVRKFTVSKEEEKFGRMRSFNPSSFGRWVPAGSYTGLYRNNSVIMTDTPDEISDQVCMIHASKDHILINGLGLGCITELCLQKEKVSKVTVIEISEDVIKLVSPYLQEKYGDKLEIVQADAFLYKPPKSIRYGAVWHDIWDNICSDNLTEMQKLHRKYGKKTEWQWSWCRDLCKRWR